MPLLTINIAVKTKCPSDKPEVTIYDCRIDGCPGFGLRILKSGRKTWVFSYRFNGKKKRLTIGDFPAMPLLEARQIAYEKRNILRSGVDPDEREEPNQNSLESFWKIFLAAQIKKGKKTVAHDVRRWNRVIKPALGSKNINDIMPDDIERIHDEVKKTGPYEANRILSLLSKIFSQGKRWGYIMGSNANPCGFVERCKEKPREEFYSIPELQLILDAADSDTDVFAQALIYIYVFTGKRKKEPLQCTWDDFYSREIINPETNQKITVWFLRLKDTKSGRQEECYLPDIVAALIQKLPRLKDCLFIFPNIKTKKTLSDFPRWALKRMRKRCGFDFTIHKFRHTYATYQLGEGTSLEIVARMLNQSSKAVTDRYAHLADTPKIQAGNLFADKLISFTQIKKKAE